MTYQRDLANAFEMQAEWRREKAEQHPQDAKRNLTAAKTFDELALQADRGDFDRELFGRYADLAYWDDDTSTTVSVEASELNRCIGFHSFPTTVDEYLTDLLDRVRRATP